MRSITGSSNTTNLQTVCIKGYKAIKIDEWRLYSRAVFQYYREPCQVNNGPEARR